MYYNLKYNGNCPGEGLLEMKIWPAFDQIWYFKVNLVFFFSPQPVPYLICFKF